MKPTKEYNGRSRIRMFNCDNRELMNQVDDNYYDLAICDPEYGINVAKNGTIGGNNAGTAKEYGKKDWDSKSVDKKSIDSTIRISKNQIIFGANHFVSKIAIDSPCWIVWDKNNSGNFADCELAWTSFKTAVRKFTHTWNGMLQHDMSNKQIRIHHTEKPIRLYRWILKNYAEPNQKIFDGWGGSMSIAIACWDLGFDLDICELDTDYFNDAVKRFENHISQTQLF